MVQIDVLLLEKKITDTNSFGMNLLRLNDAASDKHRTGLSWNDHDHKKRKKKHRGDGILRYIISRKTGAFYQPTISPSISFLDNRMYKLMRAPLL